MSTSQLLRGSTKEISNQYPNSTREVRNLVKMCLHKHTFRLVLFIYIHHTRIRITHTTRTTHTTYTRTPTRTYVNIHKNAHMREQRHNSKIGVFYFPHKIMLFFLYKRLNLHNNTLKNGHQGRPTTLNVYVKIMYIENLFFSPENYHFLSYDVVWQIVLRDIWAWSARLLA